MKIAMLIDDKSSSRLTKEHGLSLYIETADVKILFDTGATGNFIDNAVKMGILKEILGDKIDYFYAGMQVEL